MHRSEEMYLSLGPMTPRISSLPLISIHISVLCLYLIVFAFIIVFVFVFLFFCICTGICVCICICICTCTRICVCICIYICICICVFLVDLSFAWILNTDDTQTFISSLPLTSICFHTLHSPLPRSSYTIQHNKLQNLFTFYEYHVTTATAFVLNQKSREPSYFL